MPTPQRDEVNALGGKLGQIGVDGETAVEDQLFRNLLRVGLPVVDKAQNGIVLRLLADCGLGVAKDAGVGVARQHGEHAALAAAALGDVVLLQERLMAVVGNGVEVQIDGLARAEYIRQFGCFVVPPVHERSRKRRIDQDGVIRERGALGNGVQSGKQSQALIQCFGHDLGGSADARELERQQGADGRAGRDHARAGHAYGLQHGIKLHAGQIEGKQEEAGKVGVKGARAEVEHSDIGDDGSRSALVRRPARQAPDAFPCKDVLDVSQAGRHALLAQELLDLVDGGAALSAQGDDAGRPRVSAFGFGRRSGRWGPEEVGRGLFSEASQEVAEGTRGVVAASGGFFDGASFMEVGSEGLVLPHGQAVGPQEKVRAVLHRSA